MKKVIIPLLLISIAMGGCSGKKTEKKSKPIPYVKVAKSETKTVPYYVRTIGNTEAYEQVNIKPQVQGELTGVFFSDGSKVKEGDLLFTIDPRIYEADLKEAEGQYIESKSGLEYNVDREQRYKELLPEDYVSQLDYDSYVSSTHKSIGQVKQAKGAVEKAKVNLDYCTITSPLNGRCGRRLVDPGNIVSEAETTSLLTINQITPLYAYFAVPERYLPEIKKYNRKTEEGLVVKVAVIGDDQQEFEGHLDFIDNTVDQKTGTIMIRAVLPNEDESLWPGQFLHVNIILYEIENAVLIPENAVQYDIKGPYVFIAKEDQTVEKMNVTLGQNLNGKQVISKGLKGDEEVVTEGQLSLRSGGKYQVKEESSKRELKKA